MVYPAWLTTNENKQNRHMNKIGKEYAKYIKKGTCNQMKKLAKKA